MKREAGNPSYSFLTSLQNPFSSFFGLPKLASDLLNNLLPGDLKSRKKQNVTKFLLNCPSAGERASKN